MQQFTPPPIQSLDTGNDCIGKKETPCNGTLRKQTRGKHTQTILIIIFLLLAALSVGLRGYFREPVSDDLLYRYVLDANPLGDNDYSVEVTSLADAIKSQTVQYFHSNGRAPIHVLVQMFAGPWGHAAYPIFLGCLFLTVLSLFVRYTIPAKSRRTPFAWLLAIGAYLYLFQSNSGNWYSICGGMNYLFPMLPTLLFLFTLPHADRHRAFNNLWGRVLLALLGIVTGWSQECFSLPLSGGLFFYLLLNLRKTKANTWILAASLWLGTAVLVFAPGNFVRLAGSPGLFSSIINGVKLLVGTRLFWILAALLLGMRIWNKALLADFIRRNTLELLILAVAVAFGMVANTLPQSFNGISFYSAILAFRILSIMPSPRRTRTATTIALLLAAIMFVHQARIISASRHLSQVNHQFVEDYMASYDGVMPIPEIHIPADVRPFVRDWFTNPVRWWLMFTLDKHYGHGKKPIRLLSPTDYTAYCDRQAFLSTSKPLDCCQNIYHGQEIIWFDNDAPLPGDTLTLIFKPSRSGGSMQFLRDIKSRITGFRMADEKQIVVKEDDIITGRDGLTGISAGDRPIENINLHRHQ